MNFPITFLVIYANPDVFEQYVNRIKKISTRFYTIENIILTNLYVEELKKICDDLTKKDIRYIMLFFDGYYGNFPISFHDFIMGKLQTQFDPSLKKPHLHIVK